MSPGLAFALGYAAGALTIILLGWIVWTVIRYTPGDSSAAEAAEDANVPG